MELVIGPLPSALRKDFFYTKADARRRLALVGGSGKVEEAKAEQNAQQEVPSELHRDCLYTKADARKCLALAAGSVKTEEAKMEPKFDDDDLIQSIKQRLVFIAEICAGDERLIAKVIDLPEGWRAGLSEGSSERKPLYWNTKGKQFNTGRQGIETFPRVGQTLSFLTHF